MIEELKRQMEIRERFEAQETDFFKQEKQIADMRLWFSRHPEIGPFKWCVTGDTIWFGSFYDENKDPKAIARAFGKNGWKRIKDSYTCGALHWEKEVDGVKLQINEAERVDFKPIEDVKL